MKKMLFLASGSPRRVELLENAGFRFRVIKPEVPEKRRSGESPFRMTMRLSTEKALKVTNLVTESCLIIAADTTVISPNGQKALGKPCSFNHAVRILSEIQGKTHTVVTGFTIIDWDHLKKRVVKKVVKSVKTTVRIRKMTKPEILRYVETGEPMDKAGAYAAQGVGMVFIERINGSYTNVVGLPICEVTQVLGAMGCEPDL